jgi:hypothetical protein
MLNLRHLTFMAMIIAAWITGLLSIFVGSVIGLLIHVSGLQYYWYSITVFSILLGGAIIVVSTKVYLKYQSKLELQRIEAEIDLELSDFGLADKSPGSHSSL